MNRSTKGATVAEMLSYRDLNELSFKELDEAVEKWRKVSIQMKYATGEEQPSGNGPGGTAKALKGKAENTVWEGANAGITKDFIAKTAKEFEDAREEADGIYTVLQMVLDDLRTHKNSLRSAVDRAAEKNIKVGADGSLDPTSPDLHPTQRPKEQDYEDVKKDINRILEAAAQTDKRAATKLRFLTKDRYNFSSGGAQRAEQKVDGEEDADKLVRLIRQGEMTNTRLAQVNGILAEQHNNRYFVERFTDRMGGKGSLDYWTQLANPSQPTGDPKRRKLLATTEKYLGKTFGLATRIDSAATEKWEREIIAQGKNQFIADRSKDAMGPNGFQVMSSLMGHGKFSNGFLGSYGNALLKYERDSKQSPADLWKLEGNLNSELKFADGDKDKGNDPMAGYLKAVSRNPEYATHLFNDNPDDAKYLIKDRDYFYDHAGRSGPMPGRDALGDAIYAGSTGLDPHGPKPETAELTAQHQQVRDRALGHLAAQGNSMPAELRDDVARVLGVHGSDTHRSMSAPLGEGPIDQDDLREVTKQISREPESLRALNGYMSHEILEDMRAENAHPRDSLIRAGYTVGFLEESRDQAIDYQKQKDMSAASWKSLWGYEAAGTAAAFMPGGGHIDHAAFAVSKAWTDDENARITTGVTNENRDNSELHQRQLASLRDQWINMNSEWLDDPKQSDYTHTRITDEINGAANDGEQDTNSGAGLGQ